MPYGLPRAHRPLPGRAALGVCRSGLSLLMDMRATLTFAPGNRRAKKRKGSRVWWTDASMGGPLSSACSFSFIMFTGTLPWSATKIDWVLQPSLRVAPASAEGPVDWAGIAANAAAPSGRGRGVVDGSADRLGLPRSRLRSRTRTAICTIIHAHPATAAIPGRGPVGRGAHSGCCATCHRHLNLPTKIGVPIVAFLGFSVARPPRHLAGGLQEMVARFHQSRCAPATKRRTWWGDFSPALPGSGRYGSSRLIALTSVVVFRREPWVSMRRPPPRVKIEAPAGQAAQGLEPAMAAAMKGYPGLKVAPGDASGQGKPGAAIARRSLKRFWCARREHGMGRPGKRRGSADHRRARHEPAPAYRRNGRPAAFRRLRRVLDQGSVGSRSALLLTGPVAVRRGHLLASHKPRARHTGTNGPRLLLGCGATCPRWRWASAALIFIGFCASSGACWQLS